MSNRNSTTSPMSGRQHEISPPVQRVHEVRQLPVPNSIIAQLPNTRWWFEVMFSLRESGLPTLDAEIKNAHRREASDVARAFVAMHALNAEFEAVAKAFAVLFKDFKERLMPSVLEGAGMSSMPLTEGLRVGKSEICRASIRADKKQEAYEYLQEHYPDLLSATVNASTLSSHASELINEQNIDLPLDLFNVYWQPTISVTKIKGKNGGVK